MKILHYFLGLPPLRGGGMTQYCLDLIHYQRFLGYDVSMVFPGKFHDESAKSSIVAKKHKKFGPYYSIDNALPLPLLNGVLDSNLYTIRKTSTVFDSFFKNNKFDILHIHSLMGLPIEFVECAKENGVKILFTTHDYFGLCCNASLFINGDVCKNPDGSLCFNCSKMAFSKFQIKTLQSKVYSIIKNLNVLRSLKVKIIKNYQIKKNNQELVVGKYQDEYFHLKEYYYKIFDLIDCFLFNSSVTKDIYQKYLSKKIVGKVFVISNEKIKSQSIIKQPHMPISFAYLSPRSDRKGFYFMKEVADKLDVQYKNKFVINVYTKIDGDERDYFIKHKPFSRTELDKVMEENDVVLVPSVWFETFGFTGAEAISRCVPIIVSDRAGVKDIVIQGKNGFVLPMISSKWVECMSSIIESSEMIKNMNEFICQHPNLESFEEHVKKLLWNYQEVKDL